MMNVLILEEKEKIIQNPALYVNIYLTYEYMLIHTVLMKGGGRYYQRHCDFIS